MKQHKRSRAAILLESWMTERGITYEALCLLMMKEATKKGYHNSNTKPAAICHYIRGRRRPIGHRAIVIESITGINKEDWLNDE